MVTRAYVMNKNSMALHTVTHIHTCTRMSGIQALATQLTYKPSSCSASCVIKYITSSGTLAYKRQKKKRPKSLPIAPVT